jgi:hypothetical protein
MFRNETEHAPLLDLSKYKRRCSNPLALQHKLLQERRGLAPPTGSQSICKDGEI